jgi:hypothetical protein
MTTQPSGYIRVINIAQTGKQPRRKKVRAGVRRAHRIRKLDHPSGWRGARADDHLKEGSVDSTTLLIIIVIVLLVGGGGWYGRGRWY